MSTNEDLGRLVAGDEGILSVIKEVLDEFARNRDRVNWSRFLSNYLGEWNRVLDRFAKDHESEVVTFFLSRVKFEFKALDGGGVTGPFVEVQYVIVPCDDPQPFRVGAEFSLGLNLV